MPLSAKDALKALYDSHTACVTPKTCPPAQRCKEKNKLKACFFTFTNFSTEDQETAFAALKEGDRGLRHENLKAFLATIATELNRPINKESRWSTKSGPPGILWHFTGSAGEYVEMLRHLSSPEEAKEMLQKGLSSFTTFFQSKASRTKNVEALAQLILACKEAKEEEKAKSLVSVVIENAQALRLTPKQLASMLFMVEPAIAQSIIKKQQKAFDEHHRAEHLSLMLQTESKASNEKEIKHFCQYYQLRTQILIETIDKHTKLTPRKRKETKAALMQEIQHIKSELNSALTKIFEATKDPNTDYAAQLWALDLTVRALEQYPEKIINYQYVILDKSNILFPPLLYQQWFLAMAFASFETQQVLLKSREYLDPDIRDFLMNPPPI